MPANIDRREETLQRKRQEYRSFVENYYHMRTDEVHKHTFRQIHIDVPRMNPNIPLFQQQLVQEVSQRESVCVGRGEGERKWPFSIKAYFYITCLVSSTYEKLVNPISYEYSSK